MGKEWNLQRIAVLAIMMFFFMGSAVTAHAELPTSDQVKTGGHGENSANENTENEDALKEKRDQEKSADDRGYGPFGSKDLYMDALTAAEGAINGNMFGSSWQGMLEKYGAALVDEQRLKKEKLKEENERKKNAAKKLREQKKEEINKKKEITEEREANPDSGKAKWYNWYKGSKK